jgi:hypothetical protein
MNIQGCREHFEAGVLHIRLSELDAYDELRFKFEVAAAVVTNISHPKFGRHFFDKINATITAACNSSTFLLSHDAEINALG